MRRIALLLPLLAIACTAIPIPPETPKWLTHSVSVEGRPIEVEVIGDGQETVLFVATIHGNEAAGTPLLTELALRLRSDKALLSGRRAVIVPVANPDGVALGQRRNANGVDLDRNFPAVNFLQSVTHGDHPLSEPETQLLSKLVHYFDPERIISIHQPADRIDFDGPAAGLAHRLAATSPLDVKRLGSRAGSLGSWAGRDRRIAVVTLELPRSAGELEIAESWDLHGPLLLAALAD